MPQRMMIQDYRSKNGRSERFDDVQVEFRLAVLSVAMFQRLPGQAGGTWGLFRTSDQRHQKNNLPSRIHRDELRTTIIGKSVGNCWGVWFACHSRPQFGITRRPFPFWAAAESSPLGRQMFRPPIPVRSFEVVAIGLVWVHN